MGTSKNYYAILGVLQTAEDVVIRAAYKALAQRYHPDRNPDNKAEATRRMMEINEANAVLSDAAKRRAYDQQNSAKGDYDEGDSNANDGLGESENKTAWQTAAIYYPDLIQIERELARTSMRLAFCYRLVLLENKDYIARREIAQAMLDGFLKIYFGGRTEIVNFAKTLIVSGNKKAALALNEAVLVLGEGLDSGRVIPAICSQFGVPVPASHSVVARRIAPPDVRVFNCPRCGQSLRYRQAGPDKCRCPNCKATFRIGFDTSIYDVGCAWEGD